MKPKLLSFLLAATLAGSAHAAFYVDEDSPQQTALQASTARVPSVTYSVPFFVKRAQLGPMGKQALQSLLTAARTADGVTVIGHSDPSADPTLGALRALAIKQWLMQSGIPADKIEMRDDSNSQPSETPSVFNSEVLLVQRAQTNLGSADIARLRAAALVREPRTSEPTIQSQPIATPQQLLNDPAKLAIASKIITLCQNKLIRPEDVVTLLAELLRTAPAAPHNPPAPQAMYVSQETPPQAQLQPAAQATLQPAVYVTRQFSPAADQPRTWLLDSNKTLRANLEDWASQAGWNIPDWQPANPYQITFSSTLQGSLLDALGEIAKAIPELDFQVSRTKREIHVTSGKK